MMVVSYNCLLKISFVFGIWCTFWERELYTVSFSWFDTSDVERVKPLSGHSHDFHPLHSRNDRLCSLSQNREPIIILMVIITSNCLNDFFCASKNNYGHCVAILGIGDIL